MIDDSRLSASLATDLDGHFEELVRLFQDRLYGFTLRLTGSRQDAEESTQDAFVRAYRALEGYPAARRRELQLRPWLYRIALNVVRNRVRRPTLTMVPVEGSVANGLAGRMDEQPEYLAVHAESETRLATLVTNLPPRFRAAVILRHVHGLSYAESAEVLGRPVGTTKSDVHRGLRLLRQALDPERMLEARSL